MDIEISFIVPIYNTEKELARCIESLLVVPTTKEIILIDDGSTDNSLTIAQHYFKQYSNIILVQQQNLGVSIARNRGIMLAQGEYLQFVDSDDYLINQHHYVNILKLAKHEQIDVVKFLIQINTDKPFITRLPITTSQRYAAYATAYICQGIDYLNGMIENWFPSSCDGLYRTKLLKNHQLYFPEGVIQSEDGLFNFDVLSQPNIKVMDTKIPAYLYGYRPNSASHQTAKVTHIQSTCQVCKQLLQRIDTLIKIQESNPNFYQKVIDLAINIILIELKNMYYNRYLKLSTQQKIQAKIHFSPKLATFMNILELNIEI